MRELFMQKVNFYLCITFIASFGLFLTITVVHAVNANPQIWNQSGNSLEYGN